MSGDVETLKDIPWCGHLGANQYGCLRCAATRLLEENERLKTSLVEHFQRDHIEGDGPEIDRWKVLIKAALALHNENKGLCLDCSQPGRNEPWPCPTVDALLGKK